MAAINYLEALNQAFKEEMRRDERVVMWGEDIVSMNAVFGQTRGIFDEFGGSRIKDTPICEQAIVGMAMGAALRGLRPIGFIMNAGFSLVAFDGLFLKLGCAGGMAPGNMPVVIYMVIAGTSDDNDHGMSPEALYMHAPYLKIVSPSNAYDAKGLMKSAIRDDRPVIFLDHAWCYFQGHKEGKIVRSRDAVTMEVPDGPDFLIPIGKADIKRPGTDITIVTYSFQVHNALAAAFNLAKEGINAEVVDLRSLVPLDVATVVNSVKKTGRLLVVHEAMKRAGPAGEVLFRVLEEAPELYKSFKTAPRRLASRNLPMVPAFSPVVAPTADAIAATVKDMVKK
jgi:pyruvate dehydrogenase E1 component beta subunit